MFENADLDELSFKTEYYKYLVNSEVLFYTNHEFLELIVEFKIYLKANEANLLSIGFPEAYFADNFWFYNNLSLLYPIKIPIWIKNKSCNLELSSAEKQELSC